MSLRDILTWPDDRLSTMCTPVNKITLEIKDLSDDLLETMYAAPGRGLAAPQVGVLKRLFVMDATWKDGDRRPMVFIDPEVLWQSETRCVNTEGCLSIPGVSMEVERSERIRLRWANLRGSVEEAQFEGFAAVCVQHELDHLDGIVTFDRVDADTRARALRDYREVIT